MSEELLPDEIVPREIDAAERALDRDRRGWIDRATAATALVAGWSLLLPWDYSRRLGLQVWRLGVEEHPAIGLVWVVGAAATVAALLVRRRWHGLVAISVAAAAALVFSAAAWQQTGLAPSSDTWPGPGPSVALTTGLLWLLSCTARLLAERHRPPTSWTDQELHDAVNRLRRTRADRPLLPPSFGPEP